MSIWNEGEYVLEAAMHRGGEDGDDEPFAYASFDFTVEAPNGDLDIDYDPHLPDSFPLTGEEDKCELVIPFPQGVEWMNVRISNENGDCFDEGLERGDLTGDTTFRFGTYEGLQVRVEVWGYKTGYNEFYYCREGIPTIGQQDEAVWIRAEDESIVDESGCMYPTVNENIDIIVGTDDPERKIQTVELFDGYDCRDHEGTEDDGLFHAGVSFGDTDEHSVYARVTFDEWKDEYEELDYDPRTWVYTNVLKARANKLGDIGDFAIVDVNPQTVVQGVPFEVTVSAAENADNYWFDLWDDSEEDNDDCRRYDWDWGWKDEWHADGSGQTVRTATFTTAGMTPGEYFVCGQASGVGYQGHGTQEVCVKVEAREDMPEVFFVVDKTEAMTGEDITYSVFAEGADRIKVFYDFMDNEGDDGWGDDCDRDRFAKPMFYNRSGVFTMLARAWFGENYIDSEPVTVVIDAQGELSFGEIDLPASLILGRDGLEVTIPMPAHGDHMEASIHVDDHDGDLRYREIEHGDGITLSVSAEELLDYDVKAGQMLYVNAHASGKGYDEADFEARVAIIPEKGEGVELKVVEGDIDNMILNDSIRAEVTATNGVAISAVRYFNGYGYWEEGRELTRRRLPLRLL